MGQSSIALALLYDTLIPACALVALFISCMLVLRATQRKAAAGEGKSGWAFRRRLARFGRKSFLVSAAAVLFAFSCFYRAMNLADEGAATCRGSPTALNAPVSGRAVATVGEAALVVQVAIYIEESAVRLGATQGLWQQLWRKWTRMPFSTIFPVVVAECSSWCGVLSGNARFYCSEYVIWMLIAITWAYDGAELLHKSETFDDQLTHAVLLLAGVGLFFFNAFLEIPHFFFVERTGAEAKSHIGLWECHQSHDSPLWLKRLPFFFCYFIGCSWCSVAVAYRFLRMGKPKPRPPEQKAD